MPSAEAKRDPTPAPRALPPPGRATAPTLRTRLTGWRRTVADACRKQPALSLGIALAAGFAVGRLARFAIERGSEDRPDDGLRRR